jgi:hypothetical protein
MTPCCCLRSPGIEPGSTAWKATMLTITPATRAYSCATPLSKDGLRRPQYKKHCILRGSNPRGLCPMGLKSIALTTRPRMRAPGNRALALSPAQKIRALERGDSQKDFAPRVRLELTTYRLTAGRAADCAIQELVAPFFTHPAHHPAEKSGISRRVSLSRERMCRKRRAQTTTTGRLSSVR